MPRYRQLVLEAERTVETADDEGLRAIVDGVADVAGVSPR